MTPIFDKVKIVFFGFLGAAIAGGAAYVGDVDWGTFGSFGPAIGLGIGAALGWAKREVAGLSE